MVVSIAMKRRGTVHKKTIILDDPVPELEGCRVDVELTPAERSSSLGASPEVLRAAWSDWATKAEQGPIEDEDEGWP